MRSRIRLKVLVNHQIKASCRATPPRIPKCQLLVSRRDRDHPLLAQLYHRDASADHLLLRGCVRAGAAAAPAGDELVDPVAASAEDPAVAEEGEEVGSIADRTAAASDAAEHSVINGVGGSTEGGEPSKHHPDTYVNPTFKSGEGSGANVKSISDFLPSDQQQTEHSGQAVQERLEGGAAAGEGAGATSSPPEVHRQPTHAEALASEIERRNPKPQARNPKTETLKP